MENTYNTQVYVFDLEITTKKLKISYVVILEVICPGLSEKFTIIIF